MQKRSGCQALQRVSPILVPLFLLTVSWNQVLTLLRITHHFWESNLRSWWPGSCLQHWEVNHRTCCLQPQLGVLCISVSTAAGFSQEQEHAVVGMVNLSSRIFSIIIQHIFTGNAAVHLSEVTSHFRTRGNGASQGTDYTDIFFGNLRCIFRFKKHMHL